MAPSWRDAGLSAARTRVGTEPENPPVTVTMDCCYKTYAMWLWLKLFPVGLKENRWEENKGRSGTFCKVAAALARRWQRLHHWGTGLKD